MLQNDFLHQFCVGDPGLKLDQISIQDLNWLKGWLYLESVDVKTFASSRVKALNTTQLTVYHLYSLSLYGVWMRWEGVHLPPLKMIIYVLPFNNWSISLVKFSLTTLFLPTEIVLLQFAFGILTWTTVLFSVVSTIICNISFSSCGFNDVFINCLQSCSPPVN